MPRGRKYLHEAKFSSMFWQRGMQGTVYKKPGNSLITFYSYNTMVYCKIFKDKVKRLFICKGFYFKDPGNTLETKSWNQIIERKLQKKNVSWQLVGKDKDTLITQYIQCIYFLKFVTELHVRCKSHNYTYINSVLCGIFIKCMTPPPFFPPPKKKLYHDQSLITLVMFKTRYLNIHEVHCMLYLSSL